MIIDLEKYSLLVNEKFFKYTQEMDNGFNELNKTDSIPRMSERAVRAYEYLSMGKELPVGQFEQEDIDEANKVVKEEQRRMNLLLEGKMKLFCGSEEIANCLTITKEELESITISEEEYNKQLNGEV